MTGIDWGGVCVRVSTAAYRKYLKNIPPDLDFRRAIKSAENKQSGSRRLRADKFFL